MVRDSVRPARRRPRIAREAIPRGPRRSRGRVAAETRPEGLERAHLERQDPVPIDVWRVAQGGSRLHHLRDDRIACRLRHVLDPQVQGVAIQTARREVRARFLRQPGVRRVQRVQQQRRRAIAPSPCSDFGEVAEIADAPVGSRSDGVQLHRPPPAADVIGKRASARAGDQPRPSPVSKDEPVIAKRNRTIEPHAGGNLTPIFELDARGARWQGFAAADEERGLVGRVPGKHRRFHCTDVFGGYHAASSCRILVLSLHTPCRQPAGACCARHAGVHRSQG